MFGQFDIDCNKVTIDGVVILKPRGVSVTAWEGMCSEWRDCTEGFRVEDLVEEQLAEQRRDDEHETEQALNDRDYEWDKSVSAASEAVFDKAIYFGLSEKDANKLADIVDGAILT